ncbi:MAG: UDP-N-acetylmuramate--L-alanine ligase, partial [Actinobacteria bacterium]|nr:UDP-N-acetylmuramate--L-alanine ligase [Actinomycetota bacterium]
MSAIATVLAQLGHRVSGSDLKESRAMARLRVSGVDASIGHDAGHVAGDVDAVVVST